METTEKVMKETKLIAERLGDWLINLGLNEDYTNIFSYLVLLAVIVLIAWISDLLAKNIMLSILKRVTKRTKTTWDDTMFERKVFNRLAHLVPALVVYALFPLAFEGFKVWISIVQALTSVYMVVVVVMVINAFLAAFTDIYNTFDIAKYKPIKGYVQVVQIIVYIIAAILILSYLLGKSPLYFLTGLGAMTAVLLLIFKDTILGFVASIQLSANDMVRPGDWITMSKHGADGDVMEITLASVKVRNFDKTIVTIPTYSMISESFQNWRGMEESTGRRIKRSINIDMSSIKFLDDQMLKDLSKFRLLQDYLHQKQEEIEAFNKEEGHDYPAPFNGRRQTNVGVFRAYIEAYLRENKDINTDLTFLIRQLQPNDKGLPIEIYVFSKIQAWVEYEGVQSDIFDHLLAVAPMFGLNVFQQPSGKDLQSLKP